MVQYCSDVDGIPEAILEEWQYMYPQHISSKKDCKEHTENVNHEHARNERFSKNTSVYIIFK